MKSYMAKKGEIAHNWYIVDAKDKVLGRLSTGIATLLLGKNKVTFTPHVDGGDGVIVINIEKIKVTGNKLKDKIYETYSGYPGGKKEMTLETLMKKRPENVLRLAVRRMLPKTRLGDDMIKRLKIYVGDKHDHQAQTPKEIKL